MSEGKAYVERVYYSVIDKTTGKKYCDCGWEQDAIDLVNMDPKNRTYIRNDHHLYGQTIDITPPPALPTNEIVVNMNGGVGGSWEEKQLEPELLELSGQEPQVQKRLPKSNAQPLNLK